MTLGDPVAPGSLASQAQLSGEEGVSWSPPVGGKSMISALEKICTYQNMLISEGRHPGQSEGEESWNCRSSNLLLRGVCTSDLCALEVGRMS